MSVNDGGWAHDQDQLREFSEIIVQSIGGGIVIEDAQGVIIYVNSMIETMLGYSREELIGQHWSKIVQPLWLEKVEEEKKQRFQGVKGRYEVSMLRKNGTEVPVAVNATPLFENGEFAGVLMLFTDITETKRRIAEAERDRLRGELHEAINILHASVILEAEACQHWLQMRQYEQVETSLNRLWKVSRHTYGELSNILQGLRDPILESEGLVAALKNYAEAISPDLILFHSNIEDRLNPDYELALYRVAQGAIGNALRHAGLTNIPGGQIRVNFVKEGRYLTLRVEDNGKGFEADAIEVGHPMAFGLERMKHWAIAIGATLEIESKPGSGTAVTVTVPLGEGKESP